MSERWQALAPDLLNWRQVDGQWLVHDRGCRRIHLLDELTAAALGQLEAGPSTASALCDALVVDSAGVDLQAVAEAVTQALKNLEAANLIETVSS